MPRARGQIDTRKSEAILAAAAALLTERGLSVPLEEVARRAKVSKQTVYNHFGSKTDLVRKLVELRRQTLVAPLEGELSHADPMQTLASYAEAMIRAVLTEPYGEIMRLSVAGSLEVPELADLIFEAGVIDARRRLAAWLAEANRLGMLKVDNPLQAAELFAGMAVGGRRSADARAGASAAGRRPRRGAGPGAADRGAVLPGVRRRDHASSRRGGLRSRLAGNFVR